MRDRPNIRADALSELRERILSGAIPEGARLNEVLLAEELGISRTPLRESLMKLEAEALAESIPRRGFFVPLLSADEFSQLYDIRPILDPMALRMAGRPSDQALAELRRLNDQLKAVERADEAVVIDEAWHRLLLAHCPNKVILEFIEQLIIRTRRYELALFREHDNRFVAGTEHDDVMDALDEGDIEAACDGLLRNLTSGKEPILTWLAERRQAAEGE